MARAMGGAGTEVTALLPEQTRAVEYLARRGTRAPIDTLRAQVREAFANVEAAFDGVAADVRDRQPRPGKWSPREILDHLVLSHAPAIAQLESLLAGISPADGAIPADLHRADAERPQWDDLREQLGDVHRRFLALLDGATDTHTLDPKAPIVMVVKAGGETVQWTDHIDWKAFAQAIRVHTMEHQDQLRRCVESDVR